MFIAMWTDEDCYAAPSMNFTISMELNSTQELLLQVSLYCTWNVINALESLAYWAVDSRPRYWVVLEIPNLSLTISPIVLTSPLTLKKIFLAANAAMKWIIKYFLTSLQNIFGDKGIENMG